MRNRIIAVAIMAIAIASSGQEQAAGQPLPLTIEGAVERAIANSPRVKQAEAERRAQTEKRRGAWADLGPRLKAEYTQARFEDAQTVQFGPQTITIRPEETKAASLTLAQPITGLFALVERARFEGSQEDTKELGYILARSETAYQAAESWLKAYLVKSQLEIAENSVRAAESQLRDATALERTGRMNRGDVLKLELAVSEAKSRVAQATAGKEVVLAAIKESIGLNANSELILSGELPVMAGEDISLEAAAATAMEQRLEPRMAKSGVFAANFGKKVAYTHFTPSVNAFVKWDRNLGDAAGLGASTDTTRAYGIQATWDLWTNGSHIYAVREAVENVTKAEEGVRAVEMQVRLELQTALANLKAAKESLALAKVAVRQAEESYRIEQVRFRTGSRSASDLIMAEISNATAKGRLVLAQTDLITWSLRLKKAIGNQQPTF